MVDGLERMARESGVSLAVRIPTGLPPLLGDRERIRQVLTNLVENAIKYNETGGHVEIAARERDTGEVRVGVVDDGIGVPEERHCPPDRALLPRRQEPVARQGGTGLGLAIVKHILEAHGQRLDVESRVGLRLDVRVHAPRGRAAGRARRRCAPRADGLELRPTSVDAVRRPTPPPRP